MRGSNPPLNLFYKCLEKKEGTVAVHFNGYTYYLTKHSREQFLLRFGKINDDDILWAAIFNLYGCQAKWAPDWKNPATGRRLVTVKIDLNKCIAININRRKP